MVIPFNKIVYNLKLGLYEYIGSGSCRAVFDLGNGYIIKVAKNHAGIAQNIIEYYISKENYNLFAKVKDISSNRKFLVMEKALKVNNIDDVWNYLQISSEKELFKLEGFKIIKGKYKLILGDFAKKSSWGTINGKPVIIDYGFTRNIKEKYYE